MKCCKKFVGSLVLLFIAAWFSTTQAQEIVIGFTGPLSGPAAEYGQDCANGLDMAIRELNGAGGVIIDGKKYTFRLEKLDDRLDPVQAKSNTLRFVSQYKAPVVFVPSATTIGPVMSIPQMPDGQFLIVAYSSLHAFMDEGYPMIITATPNYLTYVRIMTDIAWRNGHRTLAMMATTGVYGEAWRKAVHRAWLDRGGRVVGDYPVNYYTETDFSAVLASALTKKPDLLLVGGPSSTTALVIEQARNMGYSGGFMLMDQAKPDYVAKALKKMSLLDGMITIGVPKSSPLPVTSSFAAKYKALYKRDMTWECAFQYSVLHIIARAIKSGHSAKAKDIRRNISGALPALGDKFPNELFGIDGRGVMYSGASIQTVANGKISRFDYVLSFPRTREEFEKYRKISKSTDPSAIRWFPVE